MKIDFNRKYTTISFYAVVTFAICLLLVVIVQKNEAIADALKSAAKILAPVTWGIVIAYLVNPIMKFFERTLKKLIGKNKPRRRLIRILSVALGMITLLMMLFAVVSVLMPQVIESLVGIFRNFNTYIANFEEWVYKFVENYPDIYAYVQNAFNNIQPQINDFINDIMPQLGEFAVKVKDGALGLVVGVKDFVIGFIIAIYMLYSKEKFLAQLRKLITAVLPNGAKEVLFSVAARTNQMLGGFISGKIIDSIIIGILTFICMTIMKMDFVALISVVVGVTNIIPFFGPFIGAIPSAFLLLVAAPKQVIPFVIFIIILQQFDGNILGPKILGDSTGLSPFWVMFAIFIGGGMFGFAGMVLGVPIFAVIYSLTRDFVSYLLNKKGLSPNTEDYYPGDKVIDYEKQSVMRKPISQVFGLFGRQKTKSEKKDDGGNDKEQ